MQERLDTTEEFKTELNNWKNGGRHFKPNDEDIAILEALAENAVSADPWDWKEYHNQLSHWTDIPEKKISSIVKIAKIKANLGAYPNNARELIPLWMKAHGWSMDFNQSYINVDGSRQAFNFINNEIHQWTVDYNHCQLAFKSALSNWIIIEHRQVVSRMFDKLRFVPHIDSDRSELKKLVRLIVEQGDESDDLERDCLAAETVLANFIHRVKNHIGAFSNRTLPNGGERWSHWSHIMPVLYGKQGSGKTTLVNHLLSPLDNMTGSANFDILEKQFQIIKLTETPIMFFDELGGITKMEISKLKQVMTDRMRLVDKKGEAMENRFLLSTFIGCTNRDIRDVLRDDTGNRRFFQINMKPSVNIEDIRNIDVLKIWQSVDEDAPTPYESVARDAVEAVQSEQVYLDEFDTWLQMLPSIAADYQHGRQTRTVGTVNSLEQAGYNLLDGQERRAMDWFAAFGLWLDTATKGQMTRWNITGFSRRLAKASRDGGIVQCRLDRNKTGQYSASVEGFQPGHSASVTPIR